MTLPPPPPKKKMCPEKCFWGKCQLQVQKCLECDLLQVTHPKWIESLILLITHLKPLFPIALMFGKHFDPFTNCHEPPETAWKFIEYLCQLTSQIMKWAQFFMNRFVSTPNDNLKLTSKQFSLNWLKSKNCYNYKVQSSSVGWPVC